MRYALAARNCKEFKPLTTQAEYVLPFWVFLQQPPLLISQRKDPEAVKIKDNDEIRGSKAS